MSLSSVLTKVQQRVDTDKAAVLTGSVAAADLPAAQAILAAITDVSNSSNSQSNAGTARLNVAKAAATAAGATTTQLHNALLAAPFSLTGTQEAKLTKVVTDSTYDADFDAVQTAVETWVTDALAAADARADLEASRKKVTARVQALSQWVAIAETAMGGAKPLVQEGTIAVGAKDLARAWWAMTQANSYLAVVGLAATSTAVTTAINDLKTQADDYATKLDASLTADALVQADLEALAADQETLAATAKANAAALGTLVSAGL